MDEIDRAQMLQEINNSDALAAVRANLPEERLELDEDVECSCGTIIDLRRARLGYVCCIDCQSYIEKSNKQYNRRGSRNYDDLD